jgi:hypothetical protein
MSILWVAKIGDGSSEARAILFRQDDDKEALRVAESLALERGLLLMEVMTVDRFISNYQFYELVTL